MPGLGDVASETHSILQSDQAEVCLIALKSREVGMVVNENGAGVEALVRRGGAILASPRQMA